MPIASIAGLWINIGALDGWSPMSRVVFEKMAMSLVTIFLQFACQFYNGPMCRMSILRDTHVVSLCFVAMSISPMSHDAFRGP